MLIIYFYITSDITFHILHFCSLVWYYTDRLLARIMMPLYLMKMLRNRAETICILGNFLNVKINKDGKQLRCQRYYSQLTKSELRLAFNWVAIIAQPDTQHLYQLGEEYFSKRWTSPAPTFWIFERFNKSLWNNSRDL